MGHGTKPKTDEAVRPTADSHVGSSIECSPAEGSEGTSGELDQNLSNQTVSVAQLVTMANPSDSGRSNASSQEDLCPDNAKAAPSTPQSPIASAAVVVRRPTGDDNQADLRTRVATSDFPDPGVSAAAVVRRPAGDTDRLSMWKSTGARPKDLRQIPPSLLTDSESEEDTTFCGRSSSKTLPGTGPGVMASQRSDDGADNSSRAENLAVVDANAIAASGAPTSQCSSHFACQECNRAFSSKIGLSQHRRHAHVEAYNAEINIDRCKPRWSKEEEYLMAVYEAQLQEKKVYNINQEMAKKFPHRSLDSIKSHRRTQGYKDMVSDIISRNRQVIMEEPEDETDATTATEPSEDQRAAVLDEIRSLVTKPPPRAFQAHRLWEIAKRFIGGEDILVPLNAYLREIFSDDNRPPPRRPQEPENESRRKKKKKAYAMCQRLFKKDRTQCIRNILDETGRSKIANPTAFLEEWKSIMEAPVGRSTLADPIIPRWQKKIDPRKTITAEDIKSALPPCGSAAGPDGFSAKKLRTVPMTLLRVLLNLIMLQKRLPLVLCNARTIFIPKVPEASTAAQHRPITVAHVLTRVLHKIYATRLMAEIKLDIRQRAFIPADGCAENVLLLQTVIDEARHKLLPLAMASVDVAKAFDRVAHRAIINGLKRKGVEDEFCKYITDFYCLATTVLCQDGATLLVHPTRGVRQGDPLSPLLFNLVLDEFLDSQEPEVSFSSGGLSVTSMAFADDIILTASTKIGLQCQLDYLHRYLEERGLEANASKSRTLTILPSGKDKKTKVVTDHTYTIGGDPVESITSTTQWKYLGIRFTATGTTNDGVRQDLKLFLYRLAKAPLKPQQRLVALRQHVVPRLLHRLVLGPITAKLLVGLDRIIRSAVRQWLTLPLDVTLGFFYAPISEGGLGIMCLRTAIPGMRVRRFEKLLHSVYYPCAVAATTETMIEATRKARDLCSYKSKVIKNSQESLKYWKNTLHGSFDGMPLKNCSNAKGSTAWLGEGTTFLKGREYINLVKFHIAAIPNLTRLRRGRDVSVKCRAGCDTAESLGHILQRCHRTHHPRIQRHDCIVRYLSKRLKEKGWQVQLEPHYRTTMGTKIPDLVIKRDGQTIILDAQVVGTRISLSEAHETKRNKYLIPELLALVDSSSRAIVSSVTMSYRGTWARQSVNTLADIGLGREDLKLMTIRCLQGGLRAFRVHQRMTSTRVG